MGNRASYVLIEQGQIQIFYSRGGALEIPTVLLGGPDGTLEYVRGLEPVEWMLNDVWAEGGLLIDIDKQHTLFWGGDSIYGEPHLRRLLLPLLRRLWPGWTIEWAIFGIEDIARGIGWEVSRVQNNDVEAREFFLSRQVISGKDELLAQVGQFSDITNNKTLITILRQTGELEDYLLWLNPYIDNHRYYLSAIYQVLSSGPEVLDLFSEVETSKDLPHEGQSEAPENGALIDEERQTICLWENSTLDSRYLAAIARRWSGWQVQGHVEGLYRHLELSGRDPSHFAVPGEQSIQELSEELSSRHISNPTQIAHIIRHALPSPKQQQRRYGRVFLIEDAPRLGPEERLELIQGLFPVQNESIDHQ